MRIHLGFGPIQDAIRKYSYGAVREAGITEKGGASRKTKRAEKDETPPPPRPFDLD